MEKRFRSAVALSAPGRVDRERGVIYGASAIQAVEALGHGLLVDTKTLEQCAALGNASDKGIQVRFTHPGMCEDSLGKFAGRMQNFRVQDDKVVGDIHLSDTAAKSPDGDLRAYLLDLAEKEPDAFGMSIAFEGSKVWTLSDGSEVPAKTDTAPKGANTKLPVARLSKLRAVDFVAEPAANRDGLFSAAFAGTTGLDAVRAFEALDEMREKMNFSLAQAAEFINRYLAARGAQCSLTTWSAGGTEIVKIEDAEPEHVAPAAEKETQDSPAKAEQGDSMDREALKALKAKHPGHADLIVDLFVDGKPEAEIVEAIKALELTSAQKRVAELEAEIKGVKDELAKKTAECVALAEAKAKVEALGVKHKDPGGDVNATNDPKGEDALKAAWAAKTDAQKMEFANDYDAFKYWKLNEKNVATSADAKE